MDYPTRAEARGMADHQIAYGFMMLALHDDLDAKQAELDKAHDLIKRLNDKLKTWCGLIPCANEFITEANELLGDVTNK